MSEKKDAPAKVKLLGITKEPGEGWAMASSLSEYEIPHDMFLKHCKRISKTEPDVLRSLIVALERKVREILEI